ncbi:MAG: spore coat associated protein CotJA [Lachnospiraceae bacterium]|nr:spore coat associated protein CotJA [Lachnospiraceae bacterium]
MNSCKNPCDGGGQRVKMNHEFSLAMAYVPFQKWQNVYQPDEGLRAGTIFKDLNLPFIGRRICR